MYPVCLAVVKWGKQHEAKPWYLTARGSLVLEIWELELANLEITSTSIAKRAETSLQNFVFV